MEFEFICRQHEIKLENVEEVELFMNDEGRMMFDFSNLNCLECNKEDKGIQVYVMISRIAEEEVYIVD